MLDTNDPSGRIIKGVGVFFLKSLASFENSFTHGQNYESTIILWLLRISVHE